VEFVRALKYCAAEGLLALWRHKTLHAFALFVVALSLFVLGFSRYLTVNVNALLSGWEQDLEVRLFLEDGLAPDRVTALTARFEKDARVASVRYVSPAEALKILGGFAPAFADLGLKAGENPLPASLSLKLKSPVNLAGVKALVAEAETAPGVEQALFDWEWVDRLRAYSRFVSMLGWILFGALGAAAVFTVGAITRILALSRKEEIAILHFLGATDWSIRGPFVAGGTVLGLLSGVAALLLLLLSHSLLRGAAGQDALLMSWLARGFIPLGDQALLVGMGALLGAVGGASSLGSSEHWRFN